MRFSLVLDFVLVSHFYCLHIHVLLKSCHTNLLSCLGFLNIDEKLLILDTDFVLPSQLSETSPDKYIQLSLGDLELVLIDFIKS